jgi:DNA invertase Pin-like site-specific DNA recombinase
MANVFYARSSSDTQGSGLHLQIDRAKALGIDEAHIFAELKSGKDSNRPKLQECLRFVRKGDVLHITKLDRLGRSLTDLKGIVDKLSERGVDLKVLDQPIDTTTAAGRLFFHMVGAFAEFERDLINDRAREGRERHLARLRSRGLKPGPEGKLTPELVAKIKEMRAEGIVVRAIGEALSVSRASVNRALSR